MLTFDLLQCTSWFFVLELGLSPRSASPNVSGSWHDSTCWFAMLNDTGSIDLGLYAISRYLYVYTYLSMSWQTLQCLVHSVFQRSPRHRTSSSPRRTIVMLGAKETMQAPCGSLWFAMLVRYCRPPKGVSAFTYSTHLFSRSFYWSGTVECQQFVAAAGGINTLQLNCTRDWQLCCMRPAPSMNHLLIC